MREARQPNSTNFASHAGACVITRGQNATKILKTLNRKQNAAQYAQEQGGSSKADSRLAHLEAQLATEKALNKGRGEQTKRNKPTAESAKASLQIEDLDDKEAALVELAQALNALIRKRWRLLFMLLYC